MIAYSIAILGGIFAGIINTLAGSGSAITLSILTEVLGLPGNIANGTNRVGILGQSIIGTWTFYKHGKLNFEGQKLYIVLVVIGSIVGIGLATQVSNEGFKTIFQYLLILMLVVILVQPRKWLQATNRDFKFPLGLKIPIFLALGIYAGFIQMGMGVFFLAAMVLLARYNILDANILKVFVVTILTIIAVIVFQWRGMIDWKIGLIMAVGQTIGGWLAATFAVKYPAADIWAYRLLVLVVLGIVFKLFILG